MGHVGPAALRVEEVVSHAGVERVVDVLRWIRSAWGGELRERDLCVYRREGREQPILLPAPVERMCMGEDRLEGEVEIPIRLEQIVGGLGETEVTKAGIPRGRRWRYRLRLCPVGISDGQRGRNC